MTGKYMIYILGKYYFGAFHPVDNDAPIDQGTFSLNGMKVTPGTISVSGNPGQIQLIEKAKLVNLGVSELTGITYIVYGMDSILSNVNVIHPTSLEEGKENKKKMRSISIFHFLKHIITYY